MIDASKARASRIREVADEIRTWPLDDRLALVRSVLGPTESRNIWIAPRTTPVESLFGILATDEPPPDDEECARILAEEKTKRYGS